MVSDRDFIDRILECRRLGADARHAEQEAFASAMADMETALGSLASFKAMDTAAFHVEVEEVLTFDDMSQVPDFGALVTAVRRDGGCSRVEAQARTAESDEFYSLTLHPSNGEAVWRLETSSRGFDGSDRSGRKDHGSASHALRALKSRLLALAVGILSKGEMAGSPVLPEDDGRAAAAIATEVAAARDAGQALETRRRAKSEEIERTAIAILSIWGLSSERLGFLGEIGYRIGSEAAGRGIVAQARRSGMEVHVASGETWARIMVEAMPEDPSVVAFRIEDATGRKEVRSYVPADDADALADEMRQAVLDEIETAEAAYLPRHAPACAPAPGP